MRFQYALAHLLIIRTVHSWGDLGHRTVAYLASEYLTNSEVKTLQAITGFDDIGDAATWPDEVSKTPEYAYTASWHYINVHDDPPTTCGIEFPRDHQLGSSDILTAFVNHSSIAVDQQSNAETVSEAFRFLLHWVGDVYQPLHAEGLKRGGNDIPVFFDSEQTNLHIVWDVHILEKYRNSYEDQKEAAKAWARELYERKTKEHFLPGPGPDDDEACSSVTGAFECILSWAKESNKLVCEVVLANAAAVENQELGGSYYRRSIPIVEDRILRAGWRLASWLRLILKEAGYNGSFAVFDSDQIQLGKIELR